MLVTSLILAISTSQQFPPLQPVPHVEYRAPVTAEYSARYNCSGSDVRLAYRQENGRPYLTSLSSRGVDVPSAAVERWNVLLGEYIGVFSSVEFFCLDGSELSLSFYGSASDGRGWRSVNGYFTRDGSWGVQPRDIRPR